jgi:hypothetical protein
MSIKSVRIDLVSLAALAVFAVFLLAPLFA